LPTAAGANTFFRSANERNTYGDLYQWGRIADGHENRNAIPVGHTGGVDGQDNCISWNTTTPPTYENGNVTLYGANAPTEQVSRNDPNGYYGKFIKTIDANARNWYVGNQRDADLLWREGGFSVNDPCYKINTLDGTVPSGNVPVWYPAANTADYNSGWHIPSRAMWIAIFSNGTGLNFSTQLANSWRMYNLNPGSATEGAKGAECRPDGTTATLFLPYAGSRSELSGILINVGSAGYYYTSSVTGSEAFADGLTSGGGGGATFVAWRGTGMSIRCIR